MKLLQRMAHTSRVGSWMRKVDVVCIRTAREFVIFIHFLHGLKMKKGLARVHATYQFTGDCPGFYLADSLDPMKEEFKEYSKIVYDYNMKSNRTMRENFSIVSFG